MEDFDKEEDQKFRTEVLRPYLEQVYQNLLMREQRNSSERSMQESSQYVSKRIFQEYCRLPGLISSRFFEVAAGRRLKTINEKDFVKVLSYAFLGSLEQRIKLTFRIFDTQNTGAVTKEEIAAILNYLPPECVRENSD